ncbi:MAG: UDP-N-acetylglucosamine 4,6-dehydratase [Nitrospirae bacterium RIFCSPHIGHO2_02_FULL_40_19]|nr:MAG: UDP-N-acetylglucosamine 4,6-dehydratase [Nitrospirae bacterium RIFCSPHIGHO2_02_FULL_40_19]
MSIISKILYPTSLKRLILFVCVDILLISFSLYLAFLLRFEFNIPQKHFNLFASTLPLFILIKLILFTCFKMYRITWRYVGIKDLMNIINAVIVSGSILMALILAPLPSFIPAHSPFIFTDFPTTGFPRSVFLIDGAISILLISWFRMSKRLFREIYKNRRALVNSGKKTIIVGAGNTGEMILRDMARNNFSTFYPVGFLDDDVNKSGNYIHGVKVLGKTSELGQIVLKYSAEAVIVAIPSLNHQTLKGIYNSAKECGVRTVKIVPRIYDFQRPDVNLKNLEDISIEDLIGRQIVNVDYAGIETFLKEKTILITGAGGSIGSEIAMQTCAFQPGHIVLLDVDETALHHMELKIHKTYPQFFNCRKEQASSCPPQWINTDNRVSFIVGDIRDEKRLDSVFKAFKPEIVFHAAAYKHVPMMEYNPLEAVKVNIFGTHHLVKVSVNHGVKKFIMISTDKAVRPTSIMGATKRMAEYICQAFNEDKRQGPEVRSQNEADYTKTEFISVRFGNVLGSRGSVLPLFMEQLKYGGPLTVTHKDMQRYFMTIPEAVSLVLQASIIGKDGEVLVLDMGKPIRVLKLAEELINIHGLEPYKDIDIIFTGLRPGEKMFEEILTAEEGTVASKHEKVFIAKNGTTYSMEKIKEILLEFEALLKEPVLDNHKVIKHTLRKYIKHFGEA